MRARPVFLPALVLMLAATACAAAPPAKPLTVRIHTLQANAPADLEWVGFALADQAAEALDQAEGVSASHYTANDAWLDEQLARHPELGALVRTWATRALPEGASFNLNAPRTPSGPADVDVTGACSVEGDWLRATLEARRPGEEKPRLLFVAGALRQVAVLGDELGEKLARALGFDLNRRGMAEPIPVRPSNLDAAREYFAARRLIGGFFERWAREALKPSAEQRTYAVIAAETYDEIAGHLDRATAADPNFAAAYNLKGGAVILAGFAALPFKEQPNGVEALQRAADSAIAAARAASRLCPESPEPHSVLGALLLLEQLMLLEADESSGAKERNAEKRLAAWAAGMVHWQRAAELAPKDPQAHANIASSYVFAVVRMERGIEAYPELWDAAVAEQQKAIDLGGDKYALALANMYAARDQHEAAIALAERAAKADPGNADVWSFLAGCYREAGKAKEAADAARKAIEIEPDQAQHQVLLGKALAALGEKAKAATAFRRALALDPNNGDAQTGLDKLSGKLEPGK